MAYTTNLTVPQFEVIDLLLPKSKTYQGDISRHDLLNAMFYQLKNGCQWRDLPSDFPKWSTVYSQFRRWRLDGTWQKVLTALTKSERTREKKRISEPADWGFNVRQKHRHGQCRNQRILLVQKL